MDGQSRWLCLFFIFCQINFTIKSIHSWQYFKNKLIFTISKIDLMERMFQDRIFSNCNAVSEN